MKDIRDTFCFEIDSLIDQIDEIEVTELKNEELFKKIFGSIFYEPKKLTV